MTTRINVDAHAGWPVKVTKIFNGGTDKESIEEHIVAPNTVADFYVWDGLDIVVHEVQPNEKVGEVN